jgi:hypothetical protein
VEAECGHKLRVLRTDNGGEFTCGPDFGYCTSRGTDVLFRALRGLRGDATS